MNDPIIHNRGNSLKLAIQMKEATVSTSVIDNYTPPADASIRVWLIGSNGRRIEFPPTVEGNVLTISDAGTLPPDTYAVEIVIQEPSGRRLRMARADELRILDSASISDAIPAASPADEVFDPTPFLFVKGEKGDKGDKGDQGEKGEKGDTPEIEETTVAEIESLF